MTQSESSMTRAHSTTPMMPGMINAVCTSLISPESKMGNGHGAMQVETLLTTPDISGATHSSAEVEITISKLAGGLKGW